MSKDKINKENLLNTELLEDDFEDNEQDIEQKRKEFEESLSLQELELFLVEENGKNKLASPYKGGYKKLNNTLLISAVLFVILLLGASLGIRYFFNENSKQNEVVIINVVQMAVEKAYKEKKVYPIDVNRTINIDYLKAEGYINIDIDSVIPNKEFYLDNNNKVQIREKTK